MEILAPCGSPAHIKAAVHAAADAVYLGGHLFSARRNAVNFTRPEIEDAVRFCHSFGVKVYITVNILSHDSEMPSMRQYLYELAEAAPDALIVQDLGVAALCKKCVPEMPLHASTQLSVHSAEGVKFCADAGFTRVVIARECSRGQLESILRESPIEVEVFVHGALCVSVSGQCGLSAAIGGRSGNRGLCAQPCRLDFTAGKTSFALSLKDLSLIGQIPTLRKMGAAALKIEGRMKRPEYVAAAVTACRAVLNGGEADMDGLRAVFSRDGFTRGYFTGCHTGMNGTRTADDAQKSAEALSKYAELARTPQRRVPVTAQFTARPGAPVTLTASDGTSEASAAGDIPEPSVTRITEADEIRRQLSRLGDTPFVLTDAEIHIEPGLFLPHSRVNALRRDVFRRLLDKRLERLTPVYAAVPAERGPSPVENDTAEVLTANKPDMKWNGAAGPMPFLRVHCQTVAQAETALARAAQAAVPLHTARALLRDNPGAADKIIVTPSRFINDEKRLRRELSAVRECGALRLLCSNPAHARLGKQTGFAFLHGGLGLNVFNAPTVSFWRDYGLTDVTASMELTLRECLRLSAPEVPARRQSAANDRRGANGPAVSPEAYASRVPIGLAAYGRLPLMLLRRCPFGASCKTEACPGYLTDRTGRVFPVICGVGYQELLNADILWMADKRPELNGISFLSIFLHEEGPRETRAVIDAYTAGGEPPPGFTRGLLYRGVE